MKIIQDARRVPRERTFLKARITYNGGFTSIPCYVKNFSKVGANLVLPGNEPLPREFDLHIPTKESHYQVTLIWRNEDTCGVEFLRSMGPKGSESPFGERK
jgi:PilZ domain